MSEPKTDKPAAALDPRLSTAEPSPRSTMQSEAPVWERHGKLSRGVQHNLGGTLRAMFDDIVKEGVPERFAKLLDQIDRDNRGPQRGEPDVREALNHREPARPVRMTGH